MGKSYQEEQIYSKLIQAEVLLGKKGIRRVRLIFKETIKSMRC